METKVTHFLHGSFCSCTLHGPASARWWCRHAIFFTLVYITKQTTRSTGCQGHKVLLLLVLTIEKAWPGSTSSKGFLTISLPHLPLGLCPSISRNVFVLFVVNHIGVVNIKMRYRTVVTKESKRYTQKLPFCKCCCSKPPTFPCCLQTTPLLLPLHLSPENAPQGSPVSRQMDWMVLGFHPLK